MKNEDFEILLLSKSLIGGGEALSLNSLLKSSIRGILIKGEPGVGKTTFAIELLKCYGKGVYLSTRVSEEKISEQYPSIRKLIEEEKVLEVKPEVKKVEFKDLRLSIAEDIVNSVIQAVTKLKEPLIILDSWDALAKEINSVERLKVEKSLLAIAEANKARLVFISEEPHLTTTDYLVDAIIMLKDETLEGRRVRRIEWKKVRGSLIPQKSYIFTLYDGSFTIFQRTRIKWPNEYNAKAFNPIKHTEEHYSTGSEDLDIYFGGGIKKGSVMLLELGESLGSDWHIPLLTSIICNFLANGGCSIIIPTGGITPKMMKDSVKHHLPQNIVNSNLRIAHYGEYLPDPCFFMLDETSIFRSYEIFLREAENTKRTGKKPCFMFMGMDVIEYTHGSEDIIKCTLKAIQKVRQFNDVLMLAMKNGMESKAKLPDICDFYLKLEELDSTVIMFTVKPPSILYNLEYSYEKGYPSIKLKPIV